MFNKKSSNSHGTQCNKCGDCPEGMIKQHPMMTLGKKTEMAGTRVHNAEKKTSLCSLKIETFVI